MHQPTDTDDHQQRELLQQHLLNKSAPSSASGAERSAGLDGRRRELELSELCRVKITSVISRCAASSPSATHSEPQISGMFKQTSVRTTLHLAVVIDSGQCQRGPGELQGLEVEGGASGSLAFDGGLVSGSLTGGGGGGAVKNPHSMEGEAVEDLNTAVVECQSQT